MEKKDDEWVFRHMNGSIDVNMGRWMDGWTDRWIDEEKYRSTNHIL